MDRSRSASALTSMEDSVLVLPPAAVSVFAGEAAVFASAPAGRCATVGGVVARVGGLLGGGGIGLDRRTGCFGCGGLGLHASAIRFVRRRRGICQFSERRRVELPLGLLALLVEVFLIAEHHHPAVREKCHRHDSELVPEAAPRLSACDSQSFVHWTSSLQAM